MRCGRKTIERTAGLSEQQFSRKRKALKISRASGILTTESGGGRQVKWHKRFAILACVFFALCLYTGYKHK